jgi:outer membrane protein OmpA-like peptidoglycan-associated protein
VGLVVACNNTQKGAGIGAGGGAILGAVIGHFAGNAAIGAAVGGAVGAGAGAIIGNRMDKAKKAAEQVQNAQVQTVQDANGLEAVKVTFDSGILFATGKADLSQGAKNSLVQFAKVLNENKDCDVAIYGHTDSTGSDAVNIPLSKQRAQAAANYLINEYGFDKNRFIIVGNGSKKAKAAGAAGANAAYRTTDFELVNE